MGRGGPWVALRLGPVAEQLFVLRATSVRLEPNLTDAAIEHFEALRGKPSLIRIGIVALETLPRETRMFRVDVAIQCR